VSEALKAPEKVDLEVVYKEAYDTPEIKAAQEEFTKAKADVDDLQARIQDVLRTVEAKYE
jgi:hypothetical protein